MPRQRPKTQEEILRLRRLDEERRRRDARALEIAADYESSSSQTISGGSAIASPDQMSYTQLRQEEEYVDNGGPRPEVISRRNVRGDNARRGRNANLDFWRDQFARYNRSFAPMQLVDQGIIDRRRESRKQRLRGETRRRFRRPGATGQGPLDTGTSLTSQVV